MRNERGGGVANLWEERPRPLGGDVREKTHRSRQLGRRLRPGARLHSDKTPHSELRRPGRQSPHTKASSATTPGRPEPKPKPRTPLLPPSLLALGSEGRGSGGAGTERPSRARAPPGGGPPRTHRRRRRREAGPAVNPALSGWDSFAALMGIHLGIPYTAVLNWCVWLWWW